MDAAVRQAPEVLLVEAERLQVAGVQAPEEDAQGFLLQAAEPRAERDGCALLVAGCG
jgi:hypothetical protein